MVNREAQVNDPRFPLSISAEALGVLPNMLIPSSKNTEDDRVAKEHLYLNILFN